MKTRSSNTKRLSGVFTRGKVFWYRYSHNGHQYRVSLDTTSESEAIAKAMEIRENPVLAQTDTLKREIKAYVEHQFRNGRFTAKSHENRSAVLLKWSDEIDCSELHELTTDVIQEWYEWLKSRKDSPLTESTAQSYVMMVKGFCRHLVEENKLRENPADEVKMAAKPPPAKRDFCNHAQVKKLLHNAKDTDLKFILYCGFHAGLRKEEIIEARPEWFDLEAKLLHLQRSDTWKPKDKEDRTIPLTKEFHEFLVTNMAKDGELPGPYVLEPTVTKGKAQYRYDFRKPFSDYMEVQGCSWVTPHIMRHTFASLLASRGVSIFKIAKWLGDGVEVTQKHYAKLLPKDNDIEKGFA